MSRLLIYVKAVTKDSRPAHEFQAPAASILGRAHAELLLAAPAQRPLRDAERPADFGNVQNGLMLCQILEPSKDVSMPTSGLGLLVNRSCRQALNQGMDQLL